MPRDYEFDMIIYATGFDALTGAFDRIDFRGVDGRRLKDEWAERAETFVGMSVEGFPNMLMLLGPHTALGNIPRSIEYNVEWVTDLMRFMRDRRPDPHRRPPRGVRAWMQTVQEASVGLLSNDVNSWFTGINTNVEGKQTRRISRYSGSAPAYRARCDEVAARWPIGRWIWDSQGSRPCPANPEHRFSFSFVSLFRISAVPLSGVNQAIFPSTSQTR